MLKPDDAVPFSCPIASSKTPIHVTLKEKRLGLRARSRIGLLGLGVSDRRSAGGQHNTSGWRETDGSNGDALRNGIEDK